ncbi:bifunctional (p)ppGpp synthetase/guanosine-3',5'-bis(diphosphate) 3'-pyrophosphohydrolase [Candidatus Peregrinibacteria bacterium]|nr:bifunctional (p)ppGpp synthetase/guanosine-3',5'-bis(diphosphate) 3'-pyrophosphohydrolase [Candidatus Peregrinibacteria bacterium]
MNFSTLAKNLGEEEIQALRLVYYYAKKTLSELIRRSGENYFQHGCELAKTVKEVSDDPDLLAVAILHDIQVHPDGNRLLKEAPLTAEQRRIIGGMYRLRRLHIDENTKDLDYVVNTVIKDPRLVVLRMAHRLNDVRHIDRFSGELRERLLKETLHIYTAMAGRLSMRLWRSEMEDVCFRLLYPQPASALEKEMERSRALDEACLNHAKTFLQRKLKEHHVEANVQGRIKGLYSSYRKMLLKQRAFSELTDRLAVRVIVDEPVDCYKILWIVHEAMNPMPGKLKDYIGTPKENGYRSIHTVIYPIPGVTDRPIEIQIRTKDMHRECEFGMAAHSHYKGLNYKLKSKGSRVNLFRNLSVLREGIETPDQFKTVLQKHFFENKMLVFDERSVVYYLKKPSTALDFACAAYGRKVGRLKKIRVNGREQPMGTLLRDGDTVEIQFGKSRLLKKQWKDFCETTEGRKIIGQLSGVV